MAKRIAIIAFLLSIVVLASLWGVGVLQDFLIPPDPDDDDNTPPPGEIPDGIAEVSGTVYDTATGQPLTLVLVSCGQLQSYTGTGSDYSFEVDLADPRGCGAIIKADVSSAYYLGYVIVELDDLVPVVADIYVDPR